MYDFVTHARREECELVEPADVIVIDGILLFTEARIRDLCDVKVFVDADADVRVLRGIRYADAIVPRGGRHSVAIAMILAKIQRRFGAGRA